MVPADWWAAATKLCEMQAEHKISAEDMTLFVGIARGAPVPFLVAMDKLITGEWTVETDPNTGSIRVGEKSPIVLPTTNEIHKLGNSNGNLHRRGN